MTVLSTCNWASNDKSVRRVKIYIKDIVRSVGGKELDSREYILVDLTG